MPISGGISVAKAEPGQIICAMCEEPIGEGHVAEVMDGDHYCDACVAVAPAAIGAEATARKPRRDWSPLLREGLGLGGVVAVLVGLWWIYPAAALIVGGAGAFTAAVLAERHAGDKLPPDAPPH
jgi:hypothetical protein